jgi:hypothetical protein
MYHEYHALEKPKYSYQATGIHLWWELPSQSTVLATTEKALIGSERRRFSELIHNDRAEELKLNLSL